jgi:hypothetical protein
MFVFLWKTASGSGRKNGRMLVDIALVLSRPASHKESEPYH